MTPELLKVGDRWRRGRSAGVFWPRLWRQEATGLSARALLGPLLAGSRSAILAGPNQRRSHRVWPGVGGGSVALSACRTARDWVRQQPLAAPATLSVASISAWLWRGIFDRRCAIKAPAVTAAGARRCAAANLIQLGRVCQRCHGVCSTGACCTVKFIHCWSRSKSNGWGRCGGLVPTCFWHSLLRDTHEVSKDLLTPCCHRWRFNEIRTGLYRQVAPGNNLDSRPRQQSARKGRAPCRALKRPSRRTEACWPCGCCSRH